MPVPFPEAGLVISYSYLWTREHLDGRVEGGKVRPSVIVITAERDESGGVIVTVVPVTHSRPDAGRPAMEIPEPVKRHLGLDDERSWIVLDEGNKFVWPGYDLRKVGRTGRFDYGFLPPAFFDRVRDVFIETGRRGKLRLAPRD